MRCLIVGTDRLGTAPAVLKEKFGITEIIHCNGRERLKAMGDLSLIVVYVGFAGHDIVSKVKRFAQKRNIRTIYVNRGLSELVAGQRGKALEIGVEELCIKHISTASAVPTPARARMAT